MHGGSESDYDTVSILLLLLLLLLVSSLPEAELPDLVGGESYEWAAIGDLDAFFKRIYRYC